MLQSIKTVVNNFLLFVYLVAGNVRWRFRAPSKLLITINVFYDPNKIITMVKSYSKRQKFKKLITKW